DTYNLSKAVLKLPQELASIEIECIDGAVRKVMTHQQRIAKRSKVVGRQRHSPWLVQLAAGGQTLHKSTMPPEYVDESPRRIAGTGVGDEHHVLVKNLDPIGRQAPRNPGIGKRHHKIELAVKKITSVVPGRRSTEEAP